MTGEQKGGVKNHFKTLFRIIKKKKQKEKIIEEQKKDLKEKEIKIQKNKIENYNFNNQKNNTNKKQTNKIFDISKKKNVSNKNSDSIKKDLSETFVFPMEKVVLDKNKKVVSKQKDRVNKNKELLKIKNINKKIEKDIVNKKLNKNNKNVPEFEKVNKGIDNKKYKVVPKANIAKATPIKKVTKENSKELEQEVIKTKNKYNKELEKSILKRINKIIENDKNDIETLKYELDQIDKEVKKANDKEKIAKIRLQFELIDKKIAKIKRDFEIIKDNLSFEDYEKLNNYFLIDEIDDFKYHNDFTSIELLSLKCKQQIEVLEEIVDMYDEAINVSKKVNEKEKEVEYFDKNTPLFQSKTTEIDLISKKINDNIALQNKFIDDMNKRIGEAQFKTQIYYKYQGMNEMLNNTLSMGLGLYSFSSMRRPRFRTLKFLIGSILMYNSVKGMLKFLNPEIRKETFIFYKDYNSELEKGMNNIVLTHNFINSTIKDIDILKRDFKNKFMEYQYDLPEYDMMLEKIEIVRKQLILQKKEINKIEKDIEEQKNKNKMYAKKMEKYTEYYR